MAVRYVISPIVGDGFTSPRRPKVRTLVDPGIPTYEYLDDGGNTVIQGSSYLCSNAYHFGSSWVLSGVRGIDFSPLDSDPQIINIFEHDFDDDEDYLNVTLRDLGWNKGKLNSTRVRAENFEDIDLGAVTLDTAIGEILDLLAVATPSEPGKGGEVPRRKS